MGENGLLAPHRVERNQEKMHDGTIVTDKVNEPRNGGWNTQNVHKILNYKAFMPRIRECGAVAPISTISTSYASAAVSRMKEPIQSRRCASRCRTDRPPSINHLAARHPPSLIFQQNSQEQ